MHVTPATTAPIDTSADTQSLLSDVLLNISFTLHHALGRLRAAEPEAIRALMASPSAWYIIVLEMLYRRLYVGLAQHCPHAQ